MVTTTAESTITDSERRAATRVVIQPSKGWRGIGFRELWEYRELVYFLVWRDIKVRYKQTVLGVGWAVLQPVLMTLIFSIFFGQLARIPSGGVPYAVFAFVALLPWNLFVKGLTDGSLSLVTNERLVTKIYFPRLCLPVSAVLTGLVDFVVAFPVLVVLLFYFRLTPTLAIVTLPVFIVVLVMTAMGIAFWFSGLNVRYRDVRYTIPFLTQLWLLATPVVYPLSIVPESWRWVYSLNPMVGVVEGFRWALLGAPWTLDPLSVVSIGIATVTFFGGLLYFRRTEGTLADSV